jgi:hypothetical protein
MPLEIGSIRLDVSGNGKSRSSVSKAGVTFSATVGLDSLQSISEKGPSAFSVAVKGH